jgi:hypothetical protein
MIATLTLHDSTFSLPPGQRALEILQQSMEVRPSILLGSEGAEQ